MNDIYITFFIVLAFYRLFIFISQYSQTGPAARQPQNQPSMRGTPLLGRPGSRHPLSNLLWLGIASGLAASTKWTGFYAVAIVFVWGELFLLKKRDWEKLFFGLFYLGLVPFLVYFLSYGQWWLQGHTLKQFYELHQQIWWYQTGLKATHGYQSTALSWPFLIRPVWFYVKYQDVVKNGVKELYIGNIYTMGNPLIWWAGLVSILYLVFSMVGKIIIVISSPDISIGINSARNLAKRKIFTSRRTSGLDFSPDSDRDRNDILAMSIVLVGYLGMFLPWVLSPRIMFLYHYLPSIPFLCLGLAYGLNRIRVIGKIGPVRAEYLVTGYLVLVVLLFIYFYPQWAALPLPQKWVDQYYWLKSWK